MDNKIRIHHHDTSLISRIRFSLYGKIYKKCSAFFIAFGMASLCLMATPAFSNPQGGQVTAGNVTIQQAPGTTTINQTSEKAIINWQSFNIGAQEKTYFQQPTGGVALNRISPAQGASQIYGQLSATGRIILVNPAGIYFGPSAYVNVGGLVATTANITDQNFLNDNYHFVQDPAYNGSIINEGQIIAADHGLVALVGGNVSNTGLIKANVGHIILASGSAFTMSFAGDDLISFSVDEKLFNTGVDQNGKPLRNGVSNAGKLIANGGDIVVTAKAAQGVLDNVINMQGVAEAKSVGINHGEIILMGSGGTVKVSGKLIASGKKQNQTGGTVKVLGSQIELVDNANIDVSGDAGGGEILIGGNAHGAGPEMNADYTYIGSNVKLNADALTSGDGGKVVVWADKATQFYGSIFARGGALSGNGGWVETSGKEYLDVQGTVDTSAAHGMFGTWLLDPANVTISTGTDANYSPLTNTPAPGTTTFAPDSGAATSTINNTTLASALASNNIVITTTNNGTDGGNPGTITISGAISWASASTLTLTAASTIAINAAITIGNSSAAQLILNAVGNVIQTVAIGGLGALVQQGSGTTTLSVANTYSGGTIIRNGTLSANNVNRIGSGSLTLDGGTYSYTGTNASLTNAISVTTAGGTLQGTNAAATRTLTLTGSITNAGALTFDTTGSGSGLTNITISTNGMSGAGSVTKIGAGTLTFNVANTYTGATNVDVGTLSVTNLNGLGSGATQTSSVSVANNAALNLGFNNTLGNTNSISLTGSGPSGNGALTSTTNTGILINAIILAGDTTIGGSNNLTLNGVISDGASTFNLTKAGTGTLTLGGSNTYKGTTTLNGGTLTLSNTNALGSDATQSSSITVSNNAALNTNFNGTLANTNTISLMGSGPSGNGALTASANTATLSNAMTLTGDTTIGGAKDLILSGVISDGGNHYSLTKTGTGTLTLNGINTYQGGTTINTGTLSITNANGLGTTGPLAINNAAILSLNLGGDTLQNSSALTISGTAALTDTTAASTTDVMNNPITLTGSATTITSTTANATLNLTGGINNGTTNLTFSGSGDTQESGSIGSGTGSLTKSGTGTLTLSNANSYTGTTSVSAGTLNVTNADGLGTSSSGAISVATAATLNLDLGGATLANNNSLTLTGNAKLIDNTLAGNTDILNNPITLTANSPTMTSTNAGALLILTGDMTNGTATLNVNGAGDTQLSGVMSAGALTKAGTGTLTLSGANTYAGVTTVTGGTLKLGITNGVGSSSAVVLANTAGVLFDLNNFSDTIGSLATGGANGGNVSLGTATLTTGGNNTSTTYNGIMSGIGGSLIKNGTGTFTLGGTNSYTNGTTINTGIITLNVAGALGSGPITVNAGATLDTSFNGTLTNTNTISLIGSGPSGNGALTSSQNTATFSNPITLTGDTTIGGANNMILNGVMSDGGNHYSLTKTGSGTLTLGGTNTFSGGTTINAGTLSITNANGLGTTGALAINNAAILSFNLGGNALQNISTLTISGTGALTDATAANTADTLSNPIILTSSATIITSTTANATFILTGGIANGTSSLTFAGAGNTTLATNGIGNGAGTLTKSGNGILNFNVANTYTGSTTLNAGTLSVTDANGLGTAGTISITGGTLSLNLSGATLANSNGISISNSGSITGIVASGNTDIISNPISIAAIATPTFTSSTAGGLLKFTGGITNNGTTLTVTGSGNLEITQSSGNGLSGSGELKKTGSGTLTLSSANDYTGITSVNAGILAINNANALGNSSVINVSAATLSFNLSGNTLVNSNAINLSGASAIIDNANAALTDSIGNAITISSGSPTFTSTTANGLFKLTGTMTNNAGTTLTITGSGDTEIANTLSSTGALTKSGTGTLTLSAANSYTGTTTINAGTINVTNALGLGGITGDTIVNSTGTLQLNDIALGNESITLANNSTLLALGGSTSLSGNITLTGTTNRTIATNSVSDLLALTGTINGASPLILSGPGAIILGSTATVGNTTALSSFTSNTNLTINSGIIKTNGAGGQVFNNPVILGADTTFTTTNDHVIFASTLDRDSVARTVNINTGSGAITFSGNVGAGVNGPFGAITLNSTGTTTIGGTLSAASLTTNAGGTTAINGGAITTTAIAGQTYNNAVTLGADTTLTAGAGPITFASTVNSVDATARALILNSSDVTTFNGIVGGSHPLDSITTDSAGSTIIGSSSINTNGSGGQVYQDAVALKANTTLNANSGPITFANILDSYDTTARTLTLNSSGTTTLNGIVGGIHMLSSLTTHTGGNIIINGGSITTINSQTYNNAVSLGADTTLNSNGITLQDSVDSASSSVDLTLNAGTGSAAINGLIGGNHPLKNLTISISGTSQNITISNNVYVTHDINLTADNGVIHEISSGSLSSQDLTTHSSTGTILNGANTVTSFNATNSNGGAIQLTNTADPLTITGITQMNGGNITVSNTGSLITNGLISTNASNVTLTTLSPDTLERTLTINANIQTTGGDINLNAANNSSGTATALIVNGLLSTGTSGGVLVIDGGLALNQVPQVGSGSVVTLNGNGIDLTLGTLNFSTSTQFSLERFITVNGALTSDAGINLTLQGDKNNTGTGGVYIASSGSINSGGNLTLQGSSLNGLAGADSNAGIQISSGASLQAAGSMTLQENTGNSNIDINGDVKANNDLNVTAAGTGNIQLGANLTSQNGNININNPAVLSTNVTILANNIHFASGISGNQSLTLTGQSGANNFSLSGPLSLNNIVITGSTNGNNALTLNTGSAENWLLSGSNQGSITVSGVNHFTFANIQNLTGGDNGNTFTFNDGASMSGQINGGNLASTNTLNYSLYSTPIQVMLANLFYSGTTLNSSGAYITNFLNINNLVGSSAGNNSLQLPTKTAVLTFNNAYSGFVNDPLNFNQFNQFTALNNNNTVVFNAPSVYNMATHQLTINGVPVQMNGFNPSNFKGNITFTNLPQPTPTVENSLVSQVVSQYGKPTLTSNNVLANIIYTDNISASINVKNIVIAGQLVKKIQFNDSIGLGQAIIKTTREIATYNMLNTNAKMISTVLASSMQNRETIRYLILSLMSAIIILLIAQAGRNKILPNNNDIATVKTHDLPTMSFKLRTAFNNIIGFTSLIQAGEVGQISDKQKELLTDIVSASKDLLTYLANVESDSLPTDKYFIDHMSFKLRTDLNNIIGFTDLIQNGAAGDISSTQKTWLNDILSESNYVLNLLTHYERSMILKSESSRIS